jgi:hypothetical protein
MSEQTSIRRAKRQYLLAFLVGYRIEPALIDLNQVLSRVAIYRVKALVFIGVIIWREL